MLTPRIFTENLFDDLFEDFPFGSLENVDRKLYGKHAARMMKTDLKEHDDGYELSVDLPGFKKEQNELKLENGYLLGNWQTCWFIFAGFALVVAVAFALMFNPDKNKQAA